MTKLTAAEFLRTVYLGDRACKALRIESWRKEVVLEVDEISRVRNPSGEWDFFTAEDIHDGRIVFTDVETIELSPPGLLPNDFINALSAEPVGADPGRERWRFTISISSVGADGRSTEVIVRLTAAGVHLEDPTRPGVLVSE